MATTEIIVIGGGVAGMSAAYRLTLAGVQVTVIDRGDAGQATAAGAGIIAPGASLRPLPAFFPLAEHAVRYYPDLIAALAADDAGDTAYDVVGAIFIARNRDEADRIPEALGTFRSRATDGMPNLGDVQQIAPADAVTRFPPLAEPLAAIWIPGAARVDGRMLRDALRRGAERRGARFIRGAALPVVEGGRATGVTIGDERLTADAVILATGAWANESHAALGVSILVEPQRGQIFHLRVPDADTSRWPIIEGFFDHYLLAFGPDRVVAGATRETGSGYDPRLTAGGVHHAIGNALAIAPGLSNATLAESRVGLRPASPDGLPILGPVPGVVGAYLATGFGPSGLQLGPFSGALAADLALGRPIPAGLDMTPYLIDRFA